MKKEETKVTLKVVHRSKPAKEEKKRFTFPSCKNLNSFITELKHMGYISVKVC